MVIPLRDENPTHRVAVVTILLIAANVLIYFFVQPQTFGVTEDFGSRQDQASRELEFLYRNAAVPCELVQSEPLTIDQIQSGCNAPGPDDLGVEAVPFPEKNVWLSAFFSMFMHGGLLHLGGNMLFLWVFGNNVEDRFGPFAYPLFYLFAGVAATAAHVVTDVDSVIPVVGASGAIAGVMGAYVVLWPRARILSVVPILFILSLARLPAGLVLGIWFVMQFFTNPNSGVAWAAHVGGFVVGAAVAFFIRALDPRSPVAVRPDVS